MMMAMMGLWLIVPLILIGVVAYAIGWRPQFNRMGPPQINQTPVDVLKVRYARGEITREVYDQMLREIEG